MIKKELLTPQELEIYEKLITKLPNSIIDSDYAIIIGLISMLVVSVNYKVAEIYKQINVETADEYYLRLLAEILGYSWIEIIGVEANRGRMLSFQFMKKHRGTLLSIRNLVKVSIAEETFNNNINIQIYEGENPFEPNTPGHVITVIAPEDFEIARFDIEDVRPAGTLIRFIFKIALNLENAGLSKERIGHLQIRIQGSGLIDEYIAGDDESLPVPLLPTVGAYTPLHTILERPIVLYQTMRGVNISGGNLFIEYDKSWITLTRFTLSDTNTDWISLSLLALGHTNGVYTVKIIDNTIVQVMEE